MKERVLTVTLFPSRQKKWAFERWDGLPGWRLSLYYVELNYWKQTTPTVATSARTGLNSNLYKR